MWTCPDCGHTFGRCLGISDNDPALTTAHTPVHPPPSKPDPLAGMEWQQVGIDDWDFGLKVRGVIHEPKAWVCKNSWDDEWSWLVVDAVGTVGSGGSEDSRYAAIKACEQRMGLKERI